MTSSKQLKNLELGIDSSLSYCSLTLFKNKKILWDHFQKNDFVNVEFSLKIGDELGGHLVLGHVDDTAKILDISSIKDSWIFSFELKCSTEKSISTNVPEISQFGLQVASS